MYLDSIRKVERSQLKSKTNSEVFFFCLLLHRKASSYYGGQEATLCNDHSINVMKTMNLQQRNINRIGFEVVHYYLCGLILVMSDKLDIQ